MKPGPYYHIPEKPGIYEIRNTINNKVYVGSSVNLRSRIRAHFSDLSCEKHHNHYLQASWKKYGKEVFIVNILELCPKEHLIERENYWMNEREVFDKDKGYNFFSANPTGRGYKQTQEHITNRFKNRKPMSKETREKVSIAVSEANKKRVFTAEQRKRDGDRLLAGKKSIPKEEFSRKLSESMKGRKMSEDQKKKMSEAMKGKTWRESEEGELRAQQVSKKLKGRKRSEESLEKARISCKKNPISREKASQRAKKGWETRKLNQSTKKESSQTLTDDEYRSLEDK